MTDPTRTRRPGADAPPVFTARYPGRCHADCGSTIEPGDDVTYADDLVVHADCVDAPAPDPEPAGPACPRCWLLGPCDCDVDR